MSDVSVAIIKNRSGEAPDLPSGANLSGVSTAATLQVTNLNPTHINASGVTTATTFSGSFKSTSTPTLGLGVTINSSGLNISGVATAGIVSATTLYGDGSNMTGIALSIAPISYQPSVSAVDQDIAVSIGITFTELIKAGSGNVTLRLVGAAGTVVENFGVGSSVTINHNRISINPTADLVADTVYHLSYPSGAFTNTAGDVSYVGTAYTFDTRSLVSALFVWGEDEQGQIASVPYTGDNYSSPVQIPGTTWSKYISGNGKAMGGFKTDGTLWVWGDNQYGELGQNNLIKYSSPVQLPGTTWSSVNTGQRSQGVKTDGTFWTWGFNNYGALGQNSETNYSSPVQVPGTNWSTNFASSQSYATLVIKTNGELWVWGNNTKGGLAQNNLTNYSSPVQIPGTTWAAVEVSWNAIVRATKTDGTLWSWGYNGKGALGLNDTADRSSPTQVPGTSWSTDIRKLGTTMAIRTDGTMWGWGQNHRGNLAQNNAVDYSSPVQVPGTNWQYLLTNLNASKTDGTLWGWGQNDAGQVGDNTSIWKSSPVQVPGTWDISNVIGKGGGQGAFKDI